MRRALLALPLGLTLAGCMTYGDLAYTDPAVYGYRYDYPYSSSYPHGYSYGTQQYVVPQPGVVAQGPTYYYYGPPATRYGYRHDWDRDGVNNRFDRFPNNPRRW
jgi:hypothetical protein